MYSEEMEQKEAGFSNFSGTDNVFNQNLRNGDRRGLYKAANKKNRATVQIAVKNFTDSEQIFELFNSNNSIAIQPDDALYAQRTPSGGVWYPFDASFTMALAFKSEASVDVVGRSLAAYSRKGDLLYIPDTNTGGAQKTMLEYSQILDNVAETNGLKISLRSTLGGNTYKRLVEKMRTSVIHVTDWKIQCSNEEQFQLSIAQKDFTITGASADDEYQISSSVSSKDNNTKIVEIGDKMLLIDGDTRLSGIILPSTTMVFTFEVDIINEVTKRVF